MTLTNHARVIMLTQNIASITIPDVTNACNLNLLMSDSSLSVLCHVATGHSNPDSATAVQTYSSTAGHRRDSTPLDSRQQTLWDATTYLLRWNLLNACPQAPECLDGAHAERLYQPHHRPNERSDFGQRPFQITTKCQSFCKNVMNAAVPTP